MAEAFIRYFRIDWNLVFFMRWMPAYAGMTAMVVAFAASSQQPVLTEQQKFLAQCNPQNKPELQKVCGCLLESIEMTVTVKDFNALEEREKSGQLTAEELDQKAQLVANNKLIVKACMAR